ncbi:hypothetical protein OIDMADRAFT_35307 [Oidiodendron maius Zn]|uniref:Uncharacterized protein n=1 Tax=Oidiodendron maius (strain Zn) TaxID=913774 RepID=A0A0C3GR73_OIDMZ|nr:hypothetical protein OIDMADRAFT_35307 [Oidiodendron maius Zn]
MSTTPAVPGLEWILIAPDSKGYNSSKVDRRAIRRQAMKTISARWRQSKDYGRINMGQYPVFAAKGNHTPVKLAQYRDDRELDSRILYRDITGSSSSTSAPRIAWELTSIPAPMPLSGMERVRALFGIDILNLSPLTVTHVGEATSLYFDPRTLRMALIHQQRSSYLSHIPRRFGHNPCLDQAIYALLSKAREILYPSTPNIRTIALSEHGKALRMLQEAIDNAASRTQPDVLCITELLGLIEAS